MNGNEKVPLVAIGSGTLREQVLALLADVGVARYARLPGECDDQCIHVNF
jgi:hypothetical protein